MSLLIEKWLVHVKTIEKSSVSYQISMHIKFDMYFYEWDFFFFKSTYSCAIASTNLFQDKGSVKIKEEAKHVV